jgi:hypothetical protein
MTSELVGPIRKSMGVGCMVKWPGRKPRHNCHWTRYPDHPQDPICICPCHGIEYHLNAETAEWFDPYIDKEI